MIKDSTVTALQYIRIKKGLSQSQLAKKAGISVRTLQSYEQGKRRISGAKFTTLIKISEALDCDISDILIENGKPVNKAYLEYDLPDYLINSIEFMKTGWGIIDAGGTDLLFDCRYGDLAASINSAEIDMEITKEQANHLRSKYLRTEV